jgi:hypothetical protein
MCSPDPLCAALLAKIEEQIERTGHLIAAVPENRLDWAPDFPGAWPVGMLLGHLLECLAGICAVLWSAAPERLEHFTGLRNQPVNHHCAAGEARRRIGIYAARIGEGFAAIGDQDLGRLLPTVFVSEGESVATLLLGNLEHLINHKHQLFTYLKLMGESVSSRDLYRFRGE